MGEDVYLHQCSSAEHSLQSPHETSARRECSGGRVMTVCDEWGEEGDGGGCVPSSVQ